MLEGTLPLFSPGKKSDILEFDAEVESYMYAYFQSIIMFYYFLLYIYSNFQHFCVHIFYFESFIWYPFLIVTYLISGNYEIKCIMNFCWKI